MALASFSNRSTPSAQERKLLTFLLDGPFRALSAYEDLEHAPHFNVGVDDPEFRNFAGIYSDAIFDIFYQFAKANLKKTKTAADRRWMRPELRLEFQVEGKRALYRGLCAARRQ